MIILEHSHIQFILVQRLFLYFLQCFQVKYQINFELNQIHYLIQRMTSQYHHLYQISYYILELIQMSLKIEYNILLHPIACGDHDHQFHQTLETLISLFIQINMEQNFNLFFLVLSLSS
jgi:hypothetical protein